MKNHGDGNKARLQGGRTRLRRLSVEQRVKYLNALRDIVSRRSPKNKASQAVISDFDLIAAGADEHEQALKAALQ